MESYNKKEQNKKCFVLLFFDTFASLKYIDLRSNPDGGICLHAYKTEFTHPVKKEPIRIKVNPPNDNLWSFFSENIK